MRDPVGNTENTLLQEIVGVLVVLALLAWLGYDVFLSNN